MPNRVLVTRPLDHAHDFMVEIASLGYKPVLAPLLTIIPLPQDLESVPVPDAVVLSSANSVSPVALPPFWHNIPAFCVGDRTGDAARAAGFTHVTCGEGGINDLAPILRARLLAGSNIAYLRGEDVRYDLKTVLPDYRVTDILTYRAEDVTDLPDAVLNSFSTLGVITLFSPRTGRILADILARHHLAALTPQIKLLCLSPSVVESVSDYAWKEIHIADHPTQSAMLEQLASL